MTNLFKLKKDGKTVGYLKITDGAVWFKDAEEFSIWDLYGAIHDGYDIDFDEALPYVTDDRNGEKVFAGDEVNSIPTSTKYKVKYHPETCQWFIENKNECFDIEVGTEGKCEYIELVKDSD